MDREAIISAVEVDTGIDTTKVTTLCENHIDEVQDYHICRNKFNHHFSFLRKYGYLYTTIQYSTGTVDVTQDSTTVSGTGTTFTAGMVGRIFKVSGEDDYYEIAAYVGTTEITLSSPYLGSTATGSSYTIDKIYYDLASDFGNMVWIKQMDSPRRIMPQPVLGLQDVYPDEWQLSGEIAGYALSGANSSRVPLIRLLPIQTTRKNLYYCYDKKLATINATGEESLIPTDWHYLFVYKLSEIVFSFHDLIPKQLAAKEKFEDMLIAFIRDDKRILEDEELVMKDEILASRTPRVQLPGNYPRDY